MKMINRLVEPSGGRILVDGSNVLEQAPVDLRRGIDKAARVAFFYKCAYQRIGVLRCCHWGHGINIDRKVGISALQRIIYVGCKRGDPTAARQEAANKRQSEWRLDFRQQRVANFQDFVERRAMGSFIHWHTPSERMR